MTNSVWKTHISAPPVNTDNGACPSSRKVDINNGDSDQSRSSNSLGQVDNTANSVIIGVLASILFFLAVGAAFMQYSRYKRRAFGGGSGSLRESKYGASTLDRRPSIRDILNVGRRSSGDDGASRGWAREKVSGDSWGESMPDAGADGLELPTTLKRTGTGVDTYDANLLVSAPASSAASSKNSVTNKPMGALIAGMLRAPSIRMPSLKGSRSRDVSLDARSRSESAHAGDLVTEVTANIPPK